MIKLNVIGHLGKDALVNNVNGRNVINFTVAHTEKFKDAQGTQKERTVWVDCAYWTDRTAIAPYLKKGTQVYVEGNPDVRVYTNPQGVATGVITLRVNTVQLLGTKPVEGAAQGYATSQVANSTAMVAEQSHPSSIAPVEMAEPIDDLPF